MVDLQPKSVHRQGLANSVMFQGSTDSRICRHNSAPIPDGTSLTSGPVLGVDTVTTIKGVVLGAKILYSHYQNGRAAPWRQPEKSLVYAACWKRHYRQRLTSRAISDVALLLKALHLLLGAKSTNAFYQAASHFTARTSSFLLDIGGLGHEIAASRWSYRDMLLMKPARPGCGFFWIPGGFSQAAPTASQEPR